MLELRGQIASLQMTLDKQQMLTLRLTGDVTTQYDELVDKDLDISIKVHREKRSLNANSYAWVLIKKLSQKANIEPIEIYRKYILELGIFRQFEINETAFDTFVKSWEMHGYGWICQKIDYAEHDGFVLLNAYYGSSTYNTKQMSRLIDNLVNDCKLQGIQVLSASEIDLLKKEWGN